jgi:hypothetical protein
MPLMLTTATIPIQQPRFIPALTAMTLPTVSKVKRYTQDLMVTMSLIAWTGKKSIPALMVMTWLTVLTGIKSTQALMGILSLSGLTATRYIRVVTGMKSRTGLTMSDTKFNDLDPKTQEAVLIQLCKNLKITMGELKEAYEEVKKVYPDIFIDILEI